MKAAKQIFFSALLIALAMILLRFCVFNDFTDIIPLGRYPSETDTDEATPVFDNDASVRVEAFEIRDGFLRVRLKPLARGHADLYLKSADGGENLVAVYRIDSFRSIYNLSNGNFTGDAVLLIGFTLFYLCVGAIMLWHYSRARGSDFYAYASIYYMGFSVFALACGGLMLYLTLKHFFRPYAYSMINCYGIINTACWQYMILTAPLALIFALSMLISNIALLKHERTRLQNLLGIAVGLALIIGEVLGFLLQTRNLSGSEAEVRFQSMLANVYSTVFIYFECMLAGSVVCGIKAARREPEGDMDYIIILGCAFRNDGTLTPLLRGRADRALAFWRRQAETSGKVARLIASGGQGADETMPEAEAIKRYLVEKDVDPEMILCEDKSSNTLENMLYSRALIDARAPGRVAFATTNYHVFRSGVWANRAGLKAEGMGSPTVWWYWPNAFMRECLGLMKYRWKQELLLLALLMLFYGALTMIL